MWHVCFIDSILSNMARKHITVYAVHASISTKTRPGEVDTGSGLLHLLEGARYNHQQFFGGYPLVNIQQTMENHHFSWENSTISMAIFNSKLLNYQRVSALSLQLCTANSFFSESKVLQVQSIWLVVSAFCTFFWWPTWSWSVSSKCFIIMARTIY